jgi:hypothetical protein
VISSSSKAGDSFAAVARLLLPQCVLEWFDREGLARDIRQRRLTRAVVFLAFIHYALEGFSNLTYSMSHALARFRDGRFEFVSAGSVTPARRRLSVGVLQRALQHIHDLAASARAPALCGFRVISVDGTTFSTADSAANENAYGRPKASRGKSAYPRMRAVLAMDAATNMFIAERHGHYGVAEVKLADQLIPELCAEDVLIELDRGLAHCDRLRAIRQRGAHALGRVKRDVKLPVLKRLPDGSYLSAMRPRRLKHVRVARGRHEADLPVRVIRYRVSQGRERGKLIRLVTTVTDHERLPAMQAAQGYALRWGVEVGIRELKHMRQRFLQPCFPGQSAASVEQEYYAMLAAHAALRCLMAHAAKENGVNATRLSLSGALRALNVFLENPPSGGRELDSWASRLAGQIARSGLPDRSPRSFPRAVKRKMSRYPTRTRSRPPTRAPVKIKLQTRP